jgi:acetolactate synthase-1/2/3 large subunit
LKNPDFAALARAYGAFGEVVDSTADFAAAVERAQAHMKSTGLPALIELRYDANLLTPNATLETIRQTALKAQGKS